MLAAPLTAVAAKCALAEILALAVGNPTEPARPERELLPSALSQDPAGGGASERGHPNWLESRRETLCDCRGWLRRLRFEKRLELRHSESRDRVLIFIENFVHEVLDIPVAEERDHVLVAAAFGVRLAVGIAGNIAAYWTDFLQRAVWPINPQLALKNQRNVVRLVPMQSNLRVGIELEQDVDDPFALVHRENMVGDVVKPLDRIPADVASIKRECGHVFPFVSLSRALADGSSNLF